jgi:MYXO-CTERM domain-containing protein
MLGSLVFLVSATAWAGPGDPDDVGVYTEERIFNGEPAAPCAWPTTVLIQNGPSLCTGTLVHPQVVSYAAHCGANGTTVTFGENSGGMTVPCEFSMTNPGYAMVPDDQAHDWAFCKLPAPIEDIPVTPVVFGCEASILVPGAEIAIAGFGQTNTMGAGVKHWNMTTLTGVDLTNGTYTLGGDGLPSVCPGDSGGPAFIRYPDNSWHAFGIASTVTGGCGGFGTHSSIPHAVPWIEMETGIDITPCHDVDAGTPLLDQAWTPTPQCGHFYSGEPGMGYGSWADGCSGTPFVPLSDSCGAPFNDGDETPPTVEITSPMDGAEFGEPIEDETGGEEECLEQIDVSVAASDDSGYMKSVTVRVDCDLEVCPFETPALAAEPWVFQGLTFPAGQFTLTGVAEDFSGNIAESEPVGIGVCAPPPPPEGETGEDAGGNEDGGKGCGCTATTDRTAHLSWMLLVLGLGLRRRRRA